MHTYRIHFRLKNGYKNSRLIPSFSEEEARAEFQWIIRTVYEEEPEILSVEKLPRNGGVIIHDEP